MTVYVDTSILRIKGKAMCHMLADTEEELHAMAYTLCIERDNFHRKNILRYNLHIPKKKQAIEMGAIEIGRKKVASLIRKNSGERKRCQ